MHLVGLSRIQSTSGVTINLCLKTTPQARLLQFWCQNSVPGKRCFASTHCSAPLWVSLNPTINGPWMLLFQGLKRPKLEKPHTPSDIEINNGWSLTFTPLCLCSLALNWELDQIHFAWHFTISVNMTTWRWLPEHLLLSFLPLTTSCSSFRCCQGSLLSTSDEAVRNVIHHTSASCVFVCVPVQLLLTLTRHV
jgi:hypothetical protein